MLAERGYETIDGVDLSPEMIAIAETRGIYRRLEGGVDLTLPPGDGWAGRADLVIVGGVFTVGHIPPIALHEVAKWARPGGVLITTVRPGYFDTTDYDLFSTRRAQDHWQTTQELRYVSGFSDQWDIVAGLYYFEQDITYNEGRLVRPTFLPPPATEVTLALGGKMDAENFGIFWNNDIYIGEGFTAQIGIRYTDESKTANIFTASPERSSGTPIAAASTIPSSSTTTFSTSFG